MTFSATQTAKQTPSSGHGLVALVSEVLVNVLLGLVIVVLVVITGTGMA